MNSLYEILTFFRTRIVWSLPTNPITFIIYVAFSLYGYTKLNPYIEKPKHPLAGKVLALLYAICLLGFINFILENIWLTFFFIRFHYFNGGGWLEHVYFDEPATWPVNYLRNFGFMLVLYVLSKDMWKRVELNRKTLAGVLAMTLFLFFYFFASPSYVLVDWSYGIAYGYDEASIINGFLWSLTGKPILFYTYFTIFKNEAL